MSDPTPRAEGLRKYARHLKGCAVLMPVDSWKCTCGLAAALAASDTEPGLTDLELAEFDERAQDWNPVFRNRIRARLASPDPTGTSE